MEVAERVNRHSCLCKFKDEFSVAKNIVFVPTVESQAYKMGRPEWGRAAKTADSELHHYSWGEISDS